MARDSEAQRAKSRRPTARTPDGAARLSVRPPDSGLRANAPLDPNRSSVRRVTGNRASNPRSSVPPRVVEAGNAGSLGSRVEPRASTNTNPRNRRVARPAPTVPAGPSLLTRIWRALFAAGGKTFRAILQLTSKLSARIEHEAPEAAPVPAPAKASPYLTRVLRLLAVLAVVGAGYGLAQFVRGHLTSAAAFAIDGIELKGLARLPRDELLHAAGIGLGMNVFARSPEDIHARLLRHPWILSAEVRRELPSRFAISVRERDPIALLVVEACTPPSSESTNAGKGDDDPACEEASSLYLVSADAKMFKRISGREPVDLPVITGITRARLASDADLSRRVVSQAVGLMQAYRQSELWRRNPIGEIHLESNDGFSLYVGDDLTYVRLGLPPFEQKLSRMKKVFERLEHEHARAEYVYLDNEQRPDRVAVRLR